MSFLWPLTAIPAAQSAQQPVDAGFDWVGVILAIGLVGFAAFIGLAMRWRRRSAGRDGVGPNR